MKWKMGTIIMSTAFIHQETCAWINVAGRTWQLRPLENLECQWDSSSGSSVWKTLHPRISTVRQAKLFILYHTPLEDFVFLVQHDRGTDHNNKTIISVKLNWCRKRSPGEIEYHTKGIEIQPLGSNGQKINQRFVSLPCHWPPQMFGRKDKIMVKSSRASSLDCK